MPDAVADSLSRLGIFQVTASEVLPFAEDEAGMRDELGLAALSDYYADTLFPHFTVLLTRARYFFLAAALAEHAVDKQRRAPRRGMEMDEDIDELSRRRAPKAISAWKGLETALKDALKRGEGTGARGIIGTSFAEGRFSKHLGYRTFSRYLPCLYKLQAVHPEVTAHGSRRWFQVALGAANLWNPEFHRALREARNDVQSISGSGASKAKISFKLTSSESAWLAKQLADVPGYGTPSLSSAILAMSSILDDEKETVSQRLSALREKLDKNSPLAPLLQEAECSARLVSGPNALYRDCVTLLETRRRGLPLAEIDGLLAAHRDDYSIAKGDLDALAARERNVPKLNRPVSWLRIFLRATSATPQTLVQRIKEIVRRETAVAGLRGGRQPALSLEPGRLVRGDGFLRILARKPQGNSPANYAGASEPSLRLGISLELLSEIRGRAC